uniref:Cytochrome P450 n=1 Tax=Globodera rostochiensis TaxID=31243 RepID=A0A914HK50_GLORO
MLLCLVAVSLFIFAVCRLYGILSTHMRLKRTSDGIYNIADTIPFIGQAHVFPKNSFTFSSFLVEHANEAIRKGHHLMRWWFANKFFIFMMDGETAKIILESTVELKKGPDYKFFHQWLGNGVLVSDGDHWLRQRRMLLPIFHFSMLEQYTPTFNKYGRLLAQNLAELQGKRELVDVSPLLVKCALYNVTESVMGVQMDLEQKMCRKYMEAIKNFVIYQHIYALCPLYILFPVTWYLFGHGFATRRCVRALKAFSAKVVEDRIRINTANGGIKKDGLMHAEGSLYKGKIMAFLDFLLALKGEDKLSIKQVREQVDAFMFGGHDTIANLDRRSGESITNAQGPGILLIFLLLPIPSGESWRWSGKDKKSPATPKAIKAAEPKPESSVPGPSSAPVVAERDVGEASGNDFDTVDDFGAEDK